MVKAFHGAGIEVILDVVFNHTAEGGEGGPTYSFRGLDNSLYYLLDEQGRYLNFTGCGNTVSSNNQVVRAFILTVLAVMAVCIGPFLAHPRSLVDNTIKFPLGLASVTSQASSPLPGHVIAGTGAFGHAVVVAALVLAGLTIVAWLVVRPPRTVPRAAPNPPSRSGSATSSHAPSGRAAPPDRRCRR